MAKETMALVFNEREWVAMGWFTKKEMEQVDAGGLIGKRHGVNCYLAHPVPAFSGNYPRTDNDIVCGSFGCKEVGKDNKIINHPLT